MSGNIKHLVFSVCVAFVLCAFASVASARTIYVPDDYAKIRWAVNNASAGDTIIVRDGIYYESITVDKQLTIKSENGPENCIVDGTGSNVFTLEADGIRIEGFTITEGFVGIHLRASNNNSISNNNIILNIYGIDLWCSNDNSISNNTIRWNYFGISISRSENNSISNNSISLNDQDGIYIWYSNNSSISNNGISLNDYYGISLCYSNGNIIYLNNFINNTYNAFSLNSTNIWNSTEPITYTYRGSKFENYMGNYWDNYTGYDENGDGIGDIPYSINADEDKYPLIERFENYFVPTPAKIFDTGRPENPYPSISGKFIGTIRTSKKVIAKKLYTYACEGTGGHTEYAIIWNKTWCAYAEWDGYKEDWMNISFNKTVILMPYETYNITIVTGSYPQIHHTSSLKTENGWINCTEFTDANGKKYEDWIPAIKLWS